MDEKIQDVNENEAPKGLDSITTIVDLPDTVPCIDITLIHRLITNKGDKGAHSIESICPACGVSLYWYREAIPKKVL
jgi:hypothetical protein